MNTEFESEPLASVTSATLDANYLLSHDAQGRVLKVLRRNLAQEKLDAEVAYTLTHKEIIMLILRRKIEQLAFPDRPIDDSALKQKLIAARRQKEAIEAVQRREAIFNEDVDFNLDWLDTEIKALADSIQP